VFACKRHVGSATKGFTIPHSESPLLTIAIPTFNRSRYLSRLLESLLPQLAGESRVELLISDNASTDETQAILDRYREGGMPFRKIRNEANIGPDANFEQCFLEASGKYIWIIGDDDAVLRGGVAVILDLLSEGERTGEYDVVHLRGKEIGYEDMPPEIGGQPVFEIIHDARTFALKTHVFLTFITANIINKRRVLSLPHRPFSELIGTNLAQLSWTYTAIRYFRKGAFLREPIIVAGGDNRGGFSLFNVFGANLKRVTEEWLVEPELVRVVLNGTLQVFFPPWALQANLGRSRFEAERLDELLHSLFPDNLRFYFFVYPLLKLPKNLARLWMILCKIVNRADLAMGNPLLR
jgi:abequosyltransferase